MFNRLGFVGVVLLAMSGCATKPERVQTRVYTMHLSEPAGANDCIHVQEMVMFTEYGSDDGGHALIPTIRRTMKSAPCGEGAIPLNPAVIKGSVFELAKVLNGRS